MFSIQKGDPLYNNNVVGSCPEGAHSYYQYDLYFKVNNFSNGIFIYCSEYLGPTIVFSNGDFIELVEQIQTQNCSPYLFKFLNNNYLKDPIAKKHFDKISSECISKFISEKLFGKYLSENFVSKLKITKSSSSFLFSYSKKNKRETEQYINLFKDQDNIVIVFELMIYQKRFKSQFVFNIT